MSPPPLTPGKFNGLRRLADRGGRFRMLAADHRAPLRTYCAAARDEALERAEDMRAVKRLLVETLAPRASAVLVDPTHGLVDAVSLLAPEHGLIVTLEDSDFAALKGSRMSREIRSWSVSKIRRSGADAVKALTWRRPDQDPASLRNQHDFTRRVGEACARYDIPFILEPRVYPLENGEKDTIDYVVEPARRAEHVLDAVEEFAKPDYGVDLFRLESPMAAEAPPNGHPAHDTFAALFREMGRRAGRPWVVLSGGAGPRAFAGVLRHACAAGASGYLAGRAIWWEAFRLFPDMAAMESALRLGAAGAMSELNAITDAGARPWTVWHDPPVPAGHEAENFPAIYPNCEGGL